MAFSRAAKRRQMIPASAAEGTRFLDPKWE
jgi:hypothetical protein